VGGREGRGRGDRREDRERDIVDFLLGDGADEELGESVGYMVGMIAFQALLDYFSAGTWTGAMAVVSANREVPELGRWSSSARR